MKMILLTMASVSLLAQPLPKPFATPSVTRFSRVIGWPKGAKPRVLPDFAVDQFAELESPRWIYVLPNNDVLVAQSKTEPPKGTDPQKVEEMRKSGAAGVSPNQITLLRDTNGDGTFETQTVFLSGLKQPFGMVLVKGFLYVANTDSVMRYPYREGVDKMTERGTKIADLPAGGYNNHWTRNIVANPLGTKLYVSVGSQTNVDVEGRDVKEPRRAAILEMNPDGTRQRIFASGLRNPNGMDWAPGTNNLWAAVNERDETGDDLVPDYIAHVKEGAFYGWPYSYFGKNPDPRQKGKRPDLVAKAVVPDVQVGAHTASLGLVFAKGNSFPVPYRDGAFIGQHGSWNRSKFSGYRVAFVPFMNGRPAGPVEDFVNGFIAAEDQQEVYGRPVGLALLGDGSLLIADDAGGKIWRVRAGKK